MIVSNQPIPLHQFEIWHQLFCATTCRFTQDPWECGNHVVVDYEIFDMHEFNDFHDEYLKLIKPNKQDIEMIKYDKHGNGYEVGKIYEFSYDELDWREGCFNGINSSGKYINGNFIYVYIRECQAALGKVHKKPLELKHGEFYKFHSKSRNSFSKAICGRYNKSEDLIYVGLKWYAIHSCTNIIPMIEATNRT